MDIDDDLASVRAKLLAKQQDGVEVQVHLCFPDVFLLFAFDLSPTRPEN